MIKAGADLPEGLSAWHCFVYINLRPCFPKQRLCIYTDDIAFPNNECVYTLVTLLFQTTIVYINRRPYFSKQLLCV